MAYCLDLSFTLKIILLAVTAFGLITAWDNFLDLSLISIFRLDPERIITWFIIGVIDTILVMGLLMLFRLNIHDILGIAEDVHEKLTKPRS